MDFVAIDFETANPQMSSICQVGIAVFEDGRLRGTFASLVNPLDYFCPANVSIHGITEDDVVGAPTFPEVYGDLAKHLTGSIVVSHTAFDRSAMAQAAARFDLPPVQCRWLDSSLVARRTWSDCAHSGYGLKDVASKLGVEFIHHHAVEDARAAGEILLRAVAETSVGVEEWLTRSRQRRPEAVVAREGDPDGPLYGECIVFTGSLCILRQEAAAMAARMGCCVAENVTKKTSILVVGDQDIKRIGPNKTKSGKHRKAEAMIANGFAIRVIGESDFMALCVLD